MSADLLRRAAAKLREHAEAATPGPWEHVEEGAGGSFNGCGQVVTWGDGVEGGDIAGPTGDLYPRGGYSPRDDMALVALMHPPVALALADLLDLEVKHWDACRLGEMTAGAEPGILTGAREEAAQELARVILREPKDGAA